jgi:hypothetical protein
MEEKENKNKIRSSKTKYDPVRNCSATYYINPVAIWDLQQVCHHRFGNLQLQLLVSLIGLFIVKITSYVYKDAAYTELQLLVI